MRDSLSEHFTAPSHAGFTLIEVLMSLAIFSIGLLAMSALQSSSLMATGKSGAQTEAWAVLEDHVERLKAMPFYANNNSLDDDGDGTIDEWDETMPDLVAGNQTRIALGRYKIHWQVVDDLPIPAVKMPPDTADDPVVVGSSGAGVPAGTYTVSKTISVQISRGNDLTPLTRPTTANTLASCQFVKTWAGAGQRPYR